MVVQEGLTVLTGLAILVDTELAHACPVRWSKLSVLLQPRHTTATTAKSTSFPTGHSSHQGPCSIITFL